MWNSPVARYLVPDKLSISITNSGSYIVGGGQDYSFNWITRGNDASLAPYVTATFGVTAGPDISANIYSVGVSSGYYLSSDLRKLKPGAASRGLLGWSVNGSADVGVGIGGAVNGSVGFSNKPLLSRPTWISGGVSGGITIGAGARAGVSYTIPVFKKF